MGALDKKYTRNLLFISLANARAIVSFPDWKGSKVSSPMKLRLRPSDKLRRRLEAAADLCGLPLSRFVLLAAAKEADAVMEMVPAIRLSVDDATMLLDLLDSPPEPNASIVRAFARRREMLGTLH
jgi:uncharacterized protein (DUF1778 family)